jgi:hypothetical protein
MLRVLLRYKLNPIEGSTILGHLSLLEGLDFVLLLFILAETLLVYIQKLCLLVV